jgi:hypothetical protein
MSFDVSYSFVVFLLLINNQTFGGLAIIAGLRQL